MEVQASVSCNNQFKNKKNLKQGLQGSEKGSKTHKRLKECCLVRQNRTKRAYF